MSLAILFLSLLFFFLFPLLPFLLAGRSFLSCFAPFCFFRFPSKLLLSRSGLTSPVFFFFHSRHPHNLGFWGERRRRVPACLSKKLEVRKCDSSPRESPQPVTWRTLFWSRPRPPRSAILRLPPFIVANSPPPTILTTFVFPPSKLTPFFPLSPPVPLVRSERNYDFPSRGFYFPLFTLTIRGLLAKVISPPQFAVCSSKSQRQPFFRSLLFFSFSLPLPKLQLSYP